VFQLVSDVSFEESFVLVPEVWTSLAVKGAPVVAVPNRGVLLVAGADDPAALSRLVDEAQRSMQERPWPLSGTLLQRVSDGWQPFQPDSRLAPAARTFEQLALAITYAEQKQALDKYFERQNVDIFVAAFDFMQLEPGTGEVRSWTTWAEGAETLLPQTDVVILGRRESTPSLVVPWRELAGICGRHMQATEDDPPRFHVRSFPAEEWAQLQAIGRPLKKTLKNGESGRP
jgi:hypothetical protein